MAEQRPDLAKVQRLFHAIVWVNDPTVPGKRVSVLAGCVTEAKKLLKKEYGCKAVFTCMIQTKNRDKILPLFRLSPHGAVTAFLAFSYKFALFQDSTYF